MAQNDTNADLLENDGGYALSYAEGPLTSFVVQRASRNNFTVDMKSTSNKEDAHVLLSVTLRNVR
jgi:hypothetical protein